MAGSRAALRVGLIGGLALAVVMAAQQFTDSPLMSMLGVIMTFAGLVIIGYFAARDAGEIQRGPAMRAGAVGGLIAGLLAAMAVVAVMLVLSFNGDMLRQVQDAFQQLYTPEQMQQFQSAGVTLEALTQVTVAVQIMCCGGALPILGLILGALGGVLIVGRRNDPGDTPASQ
jgi:hypothetical protein